MLLSNLLYQYAELGPVMQCEHNSAPSSFVIKTIHYTLHNRLLFNMLYQNAELRPVLQCDHNGASSLFLIETIH